MLDTERLYKHAWQAAASEAGYQLDDGLYLALVGRTNADGEQALAQRFGPGFPLARFRQRWAELWREHVEAFGIPLKPGLAEVLTYASAQALPVAVATSSDREYAAFSLARAGLDPRAFAHIVTGDQVARGKPAPDIYLAAARRLGLRPQRCVAVEDSEPGILAARAARMLAVLVPDLKPPSPAARAAADRVLPSLHELPPLLPHLRPSGQPPGGSPRPS
jgi:HAD superfamily hydrolase (TIGR01509 family)